MSAIGACRTVLATGLAEALRADGIVLEQGRLGPAVSAFVKTTADDFVHAAHTAAPHGPPPSAQILLGVVSVLDQGVSHPDGFCVTDLEEVALQARSHLYEIGLYTPKDPS